MDSMAWDNMGHTLQDFIHDYGVPAHLIFDGHSSQVGQNSLFMKNLRKFNIKYHISPPRQPGKNPAEDGIREIKYRWYRIVTKRDGLSRL